MQSRYLILIVVSLVNIGLTIAQQRYEQTTPVPILKQINRHNEDGSYSYGYEAADGSFKIETKYPTGEVYGKYGYVDDSGKLREVEYGATKLGFQPQGSGINVPPPTSVDKNANLAPLADGEEDDGQYREDPSIYYKNDKFNSPPVKASQFSLSNSVRSSQPVYNQNHFASAQPAPVSQQNFNYQHQQQQPAFQYQQRNYQPQPQSNSFYQPQSYSHYQPEQFRGHPATNFDINTGSYSVSYTG